MQAAIDIGGDLFWNLAGVINLFLEDSGKKTLLNLITIANELGKSIGLVEDPLGTQLWGERQIYNRLHGDISTDYENILNLLGDQHRQEVLGMGKFDEERDKFFGLKDAIKALYTLEIQRMGRSGDMEEELDFLNNLNDNNYIYFIASLLCTNETDYSEMKNFSMSKDFVKKYIVDNCRLRRVEPNVRKMTTLERIEKYRRETRASAPATKKQQLRLDMVDNLLEKGINPDDATAKELYDAIQEARIGQEAQETGSEPPSQLTEERVYEQLIEPSQEELYQSDWESEGVQEEKKEIEPPRGTRRPREDTDDERRMRRRGEEGPLGGKRKTRRRHYKKTKKIHRRKHYNRRKTRNGGRRRIMKSRRH